MDTYYFGLFNIEHLVLGFISTIITLGLIKILLKKLPLKYRKYTFFIIISTIILISTMIVMGFASMFFYGSINSSEINNSPLVLGVIFFVILPVIWVMFNGVTEEELKYKSKMALYLAPFLVNLASVTFLINCIFNFNSLKENFQYELSKTIILNQIEDTEIYLSILQEVHTGLINTFDLEKHTGKYLETNNEEISFKEYTALAAMPMELVRTGLTEAFSDKNRVTYANIGLFYTKLVNEIDKEKHYISVKKNEILNPDKIKFLNKVQRN